MLRKEKKYNSYHGWCLGCRCQDKVNTVGHWDCESNDCDDCALEFIYETFLNDWDITIPEPEDDEEDEVTFPFSYYDKFKVISESTGKLEDQHVYKTDFLSAQAFLDRYLIVFTYFEFTLFKYDDSFDVFFF